LNQEILKLAVNQGIWAVLFVALLFYVLKTGEKREERLVKERKESEVKAAEREDRLMNCLGSLTIISKNVDEVKVDVNEMKGDIKFLKGKVGGTQ
jgi:predicted membrane protein